MKGWVWVWAVGPELQQAHARPVTVHLTQAWEEPVLLGSEEASSGDL